MCFLSSWILNQSVVWDFIPHWSQLQVSDNVWERERMTLFGFIEFSFTLVALLPQTLHWYFTLWPMHTHVILQVLATSVDVPSLITPHPHSLFHVRPHDFQADYYSLTILNCIHTHKLALYVSIPHALWDDSTSLTCWIILHKLLLSQSVLFICDLENK